MGDDAGQKAEDAIAIRFEFVNKTFKMQACQRRRRKFTEHQDTAVKVSTR